jgi:transposase-like protein
MAGGAALLVAGAGGAAAGQAGAQPSTLEPALAPAPVPGDLFTIQVPAPKELEERRQRFYTAAAARLGVTPERLEQALKDAAAEVGFPAPPLGFAGAPEKHEAVAFGFGQDLETAAKALNVGVDKLREELKGKSLADVAKAHGVDPTTVANALKAAHRARIEEDARAGRLPSGAADHLKQHVDTLVDHLMTLRHPAPGAAEPAIAPLFIARVSA